MEIVYLGTARPSLAGGIISTLLAVDGLRQIGHDARVVATEPAPDWSPVDIPWEVVPDEPWRAVGAADAVVTGFTAIEDAMRSDARVVAQMCSGYEKLLWPSAADRIERIYRLPTTKLVISRHLRKALKEDIGVDSTWVGIAIGLDWYRDAGALDGRAETLRDGDPATGLAAQDPSTGPAAQDPATGPLAQDPTRPPRERRPLRILSVGQDPGGPWAPVPFKGIAEVYEIVDRLRRRGVEVELVRAHALPDPEHPEADETHLAVTPETMPGIYRSCDVYLSASTEAEGMGLPAFEAAISGLPVVAPSISSYKGIAELDQAALFYPPGDIDAAVDRLEQLAGDHELRGRLGRAGANLDLSHEFSSTAVAKRIASAVAGASEAGADVNGDSGTGGVSGANVDAETGEGADASPTGETP